MILTIKVTVIITIIITIIIKCKGRYRTPTTTNNGAPCGITEWSKAFKQYQKELPPNDYNNNNNDRNDINNNSSNIIIRLK